jgi:hypothetical protein
MPPPNEVGYDTSHTVPGVYLAFTMLPSFHPACAINAVRTERAIPIIHNTPVLISSRHISRPLPTSCSYLSNMWLPFQGLRVGGVRSRVLWIKFPQPQGLDINYPPYHTTAMRERPESASCKHNSDTRSCTIL